MSSCFVKRIVPFALAFLCGVAAWQLLRVKVQVLRDVLYLEHGAAPTNTCGRDMWAAARPGGEESRTWLIIRSSHFLGSAWPNERNCDGCSVRMRVLFGEDGVAAPGNGFSVSPASYPLIEDAVAAAKSLSFTPATRNGKPIPVWANVTYACAGPDSLRPRAPAALRCGLTFDKDSARTWDGRSWRVIYE